MEQVLIWVVGAIGIPIINFIKLKFGISGKPAVALTIVVSVLIAVGVLFYQGEVVLQDFNWGNFLAVLGQVFTAATLVYKLLVK